MPEPGKHLQTVTVVLAFCFASLGASAAEPGAVHIPIKGSAWRLALADLDGDQRKELIYGAYDGAVRAINPHNGKLLWEAPLDGFPFALAAADIDGDKRSEVFAATAGGRLYAFSSSGKPIWNLRPDQYGRAL